MANVSTGPIATADHQALLDTLLFAISHDLKSPLLTLSLSAELITQSLPEFDERTRVAFDGLRNGTKDLERMIDALTAVSRALRRPLATAEVRLSEAVGGHTLVAEADGANDALVMVDPRVLNDLVAATLGDVSGELRLTVDDREAQLTAPLPDGCGDGQGTPLELLAKSLTMHAGTAVELLAAVQVQLERQGGTITLEGAQALIRLPLAGDR